MSALQLMFYAGLLLAALILSAMFAGIETGIYTLNRIRLAIEVGRARKAADAHVHVALRAAVEGPRVLALALAPQALVALPARQVQAA